MVSAAEAIAIAEIAVYIPVFFCTIIVLLRNGFQRQLGWIYLAIFCGIRVAGAALKIESIHNPTKTYIEWAAILQSVGLSPLLLASMGLLKRVTDEVSNHSRSDGQSLPLGPVGKMVTGRATANSRRSRVIQLAQIPTMVALILCIVGGIDSADSSPSEVSTGKTLTKVGVILFLVVYVMLSSLTIITMKDFGNGHRGVKRIYFAVLVALPFIAVRVLWSILAAFTNNPSFSITSGKPWVQFFMATLEEFIVVLLYTLAGLFSTSYN